jgi:hypothetical protein
MSNGKAKKAGGYVKCEVCGFKIRGSNHNDGNHHKNGKKKDKK